MSSSSAFHAPLEHMISSNSWQVFLSCSVFCSSLLVICNYLLHVLLGISPFLLSCDLQRKDFLVTEHIFSMMPFPILSQWCPFQHFLNDALSNTFSIMPFLTHSQLCSFQHFLRDALSNTFLIMPFPTLSQWCPFQRVSFPYLFICENVFNSHCISDSAITFQLNICTYKSLNVCVRLDETI